uniref:Reverse transcriptase domain-containing protein n=1 Tax=Tanacetum cinerariifolium TaxID=118510 RepID=A0A6L2NY25_TANCI|nr:hypothetical protein [Tanacetum cinerariifolium]
MSFSRFFFLVTLIDSSSSTSSSTKGDVLEGGGVSSNVMLSDSSIFMGIIAALAARNENRNGDDSHTLGKEIDKVERYVDGLPNTIHGSVMATKPKTMQDAIEFATEFMNKKINTWAERQADNKRKSDDTTRNNHQQPNKRQNTKRAYAARNGDRRAYKGHRPLCTKCNYHNDGPCAPKCCKGISRRNVQKLKNNNNNRGNQVGNAKAQAKVYAMGKAGANPDNNVITENIIATKDEDKSNGKRLEDMPVVEEFPEVFFLRTCRVYHPPDKWNFELIGYLVLHL